MSIQDYIKNTEHAIETATRKFTDGRMVGNSQFHNYVTLFATSENTKSTKMENLRETRRIAPLITCYFLCAFNFGFSNALCISPNNAFTVKVDLMAGELGECHQLSESAANFSEVLDC